MAFSLVSSAGNYAYATSTTLDCSSTLTLLSGDVLLAWCKWEGATTTASIAKSSGTPTNAFTMSTVADHSNGDLHGCMGYLLFAEADTSVTFRLTLGASRPYHSMIINQFRPHPGHPTLYDAHGAGQGNSGETATSGAITTTGAPGVALGGRGEYEGVATTNEQINGVAGTESSSPQGYTSAWYRLLSSTFTNGTATATMTGGLAAWLCNIVALKAYSPSFAYVDSGVTAGPGHASTQTTTSFSSTGSKLIVATASYWPDNGGGAPTFSDNQGNTYTNLTAYSVGAVGVRMAYCINPTTSGTHTVTATSTNGYPGVAATAFSCTGTPEYETAGGTSSASTLSITPATLTPGAADTLAVYGLGLTYAQEPTQNNNYTEDEYVQWASYTYMGISTGHHFQNTTDATSTTVGLYYTGAAAGAMALFKVATGGGGGGVKGMTLLGTGL